MRSSLIKTLQRWYLDHQSAVLDLIGLAVIGLMIFVFVRQYRIADWMLDVTVKNPEWHLGELVIWAATMSLFVAFFAMRQWREALRRQTDAETDALTRVDNRRRGRQLLCFEFDRARRYNRAFSVILFDIDRFKRVNDTFGHRTGDIVLAKVAQRVKRQLRGTDLISRWGGEEFLVVCPETDHRDAERLAERLRLAIRARPIGDAGTITASFGVVTLKEDMELTSMLDAADRCMYTAKDLGRDCVITHHSRPPGNDKSRTWLIG